MRGLSLVLSLFLFFSSTLAYHCPLDGDIWTIQEGLCYVVTEEFRPVFAKRNCEDTRGIDFVNPTKDNAELIKSVTHELVWTDARVAGANNDRYRYDRGNGDLVYDINGDLVEPDGGGRNCLAYDPIHYEFVPLPCNGPDTERAICSRCKHVTKS